MGSVCCGLALRLYTPFDISFERSLLQRVVRQLRSASYESSLEHRPQICAFPTLAEHLVRAIRAFDRFHVVLRQYHLGMCVAWKLYLDSDGAIVHLSASL